MAFGFSIRSADFEKTYFRSKSKPVAFAFSIKSANFQKTCLRSKSKPIAFAFSIKSLFPKDLSSVKK